MRTVIAFSLFQMSIFLNGTHQKASIAQLGERKTEDLKVPGSIPGDAIGFSLPHLLLAKWLAFAFCWLVPHRPALVSEGCRATLDEGKDWGGRGAGWSDCCDGCGARLHALLQAEVHLTE